MDSKVYGDQSAPMMPQTQDEDAVVRLLRLIDGSPSTTQRELAQHLGLSVGKVNYLLRNLADRGAVKIHNFRKSDNKAAYAYLLTPKGMSEKIRLTKSFLKRKMTEYETLKKEIEEINRELQS